MTAALEVVEGSAARSSRTLPPGKDPVPIVRETGWAPGPVWTGGKSRPHRYSIPDRPARSSVGIPTELPARHTFYSNVSNCVSAAGIHIVTFLTVRYLDMFKIRY